MRNRVEKACPECGADLIPVVGGDWVCENAACDFEIKQDLFFPVDEQMILERMEEAV